MGKIGAKAQTTFPTRHNFFFGREYPKFIYLFIIFIAGEDPKFMTIWWDLVFILVEKLLISLYSKCKNIKTWLS